MSPYRPDSPLLRVLMRPLTAKDGALASDVLGRSGINTLVCASMAQVVEELARGAGALLLSEEALAEPAAPDLLRALTAQPPWSDLSVLVLARPGADSGSVSAAMDLSANVTVIERPIRVAALVSALRSALRGRRRQYELRDLFDGLREADQRKNEFLATLAHELRNPLAPLRTVLDVLDSDKAAQVDTASMHALMSRQVDHMVRLVDDLMDVSRVTRAKIELRREHVAIDQVIRAAVELSRPAIDAAGHQLELEIADATMRVWGDAVRLAQVFSNLLNNAARYTPPGGSIRVHAERIARDAVVSVEDTGIGIPASMLDSVFDMFVQVSDTARAGGGGLGIGLTLVKSLVGLHGGTVKASSEGIGRGTRITVALPLAAQPVAGPHEAAVPDSAANLPEPILVVDDNRDAADALAMLLGLLGARVAVAYGGVDALQKAEELQPAVAILDIGMPGMDGCELARRLREDPRHAGLALVALTGWGQEAERGRVAAAGFDRHVVKPVDLTQLTGVLQQLRTRTPADAPRERIAPA